MSELEKPRVSLIDELKTALGAKVSCEDNFTTAIDGLTLFRRDAVHGSLVCKTEASLVVVAQGAKRMWVGGKAYPYSASNFLVTSLDLAADSEVTEATPDEPCLGLNLKLDLRILAELAAMSAAPPKRARSAQVGIGIGSLGRDLIEACTRLIRLLDDPGAIPVLSSAIIREIHYRLLYSDQSERLMQIASFDSHGYRVARAIDWLKANYAQTIRIDDLADHVQMSNSSLHHRFRELTSMSPLQYQKWLRLNEARRLMLGEKLDAAGAAYRVGYESTSQFSREYSRLYGAPPKKDILAMRENLVGQSA